MLRSFRLANHRSVADEQELLLMPARRTVRPVVPVTAIYGANASGKSNLVDGLWFMRSAVLDSFARWDVEGGVPRQPFRLDPVRRAEPSVYVAELVVDDVPYTYGFAMDDDEVVEEWLYTYPERRRRIIFVRERAKITFGSTLGDAKIKLDMLEEITRSNALFLSAAVRLKFDAVLPVYSWFSDSLRLRTSRASRPQVRLAERIQAFLTARPDNRKRLVSLLAVADVGITDIGVEEGENKTAVEHIARIRGKIESLTTEYDDAERSRKRALSIEVARLRNELDILNNHARSRPELRLVHGVEAEPFDISEESAGTRSWLQLLPMVLNALDQGDVVVVDEIDASLHPLLTAQLVGLFQNSETNDKGAQLIFTTHDTSMLGTMIGNNALERDQIWFVQKDAGGASEIYPLSDFKARSGQNIERRYLGGSYGAIPLLDDEEFARAVRDR